MSVADALVDALDHVVGHLDAEEPVAELVDFDVVPEGRLGGRDFGGFGEGRRGVRDETRVAVAEANVECKIFRVDVLELNDAFASFGKLPVEARLKVFRVLAENGFGDFEGFTSCFDLTDIVIAPG